MPKILVFIPTYNERENVEEMLKQLINLNIGFDVLFIDDNSTDGTGEVLDNLSNSHKNLFVIHRSGKLGVGSAHLAGIQYAYDNEYDLLITMDCDFTHAPEDIPKFISLADKADVVVGSRFILSDSLSSWNLFRKFLTKLGHFLTKRVLGIPYDATGAFRLYNLKKVDKNLFGKVESKGYAFFFESLYWLNKKGYRIAELPISLPARTYGHSKMNGREILKSLKMLLKMLMRRIF